MTLNLSFPTSLISPLRLLILAAPLFYSCTTTAQQPQQANILPDLSGLAWIGEDRFLAVHDAKIEGESDQPRIAILSLPSSLKGITFRNPKVRFPQAVSNDLESAARIPGTCDVLLLESGDNENDRAVQRIFKARVRGNSVKIVDEAMWPRRIRNVEGSAVARVGKHHYVFLYAERAQNRSGTRIGWCDFDPDTMEFGEFQFVRLPSPDPDAYNRPLVAMDIDRTGQILIASAFDAEAADLPDPDNGPFRSGVYWIGSVSADDGQASVVVDDPVLIGALDGIKVESVSIRETDEGPQVFAGFDDENYGGSFRRLPLAY